MLPAFLFLSCIWLCIHVGLLQWQFKLFSIGYAHWGQHWNIKCHQINEWFRCSLSQCSIIGLFIPLCIILSLHSWKYFDDLADDHNRIQYCWDQASCRQLYIQFLKLVTLFLFAKTSPGAMCCSPDKNTLKDHTVNRVSRTVRCEHSWHRECNDACS